MYSYGCVSSYASWFIYSRYHIILEYATQEVLKFFIRLIAKDLIFKLPAKIMFFCCFVMYRRQGFPKLLKYRRITIWRPIHYTK